MAPGERWGGGEAETILRRAFDAYNRQDADALLAMVTSDVRWPGDGGRILGKNDLHAFWTDQWTRTRTHDEVTRVESVGENEFVVSLDQVIRAVDGKMLSKRSFRYGFTVRDGLIAHLSSRDPVATC